ncbi:hypothetical protein K0M31_005607 [Melipona bicolor]|uniref:Uncharacterized protein n=1 Tax=Melipona bicolor TaxID=60889 RepID=A0AA40KM19_9HYME|nr:hypothetical protein K0M31_005607 [Melipona bicolor]
MRLFFDEEEQRCYEFFGHADETPIHGERTGGKKEADKCQCIPLNTSRRSTIKPENLSITKRHRRRKYLASSLRKEREEGKQGRCSAEVVRKKTKDREKTLRAHLVEDRGVPRTWKQRERLKRGTASPRHFPDLNTAARTEHGGPV